MIDNLMSSYKLTIYLNGFFVQIELSILKQDEMAHLEDMLPN